MAIFTSDFRFFILPRCRAKVGFHQGPSDGDVGDKISVCVGIFISLAEGWLGSTRSCLDACAETSTLGFATRFSLDDSVETSETATFVDTEDTELAWSALTGGKGLLRNGRKIDD